MEVNKKSTKFFINTLDTQNLNFWENIYNLTWEDETFDIFDQYSNIEKIIIDLGAWVGPTVLYNSNKFKHIYAVEADKKSIECLKNNILINNFENITIIPKAIFNTNGTVFFGNNKFRSDSCPNDSTSQIQKKNDNTYEIESITINKLIQEYKINISDIAIIKVDIEGGEEFILKDLIELYLECKIPIYVSFHYNWWVNKKNLDDLNYLFEKCETNVENIINYVNSNPFGSILFK